MSVARSDDGSGNVTRRRTPRKSADPALTTAPAGQDSTPASRAPSPAGPESQDPTQASKAPSPAGPESQDTTQASRAPSPAGAENQDPRPASRAPSPASVSDAPPVKRIAPPSTPAPVGPRSLRLDDLYRLPMPKLFTFAEREGVQEHTGMNRGQLITAVVRRQVERGEIVRGCGTLEVLPDGYGFLRSVAHNYLASPEDIYVSPSQIRRLGLRTGLIVEGPIRLPVEGQENFALMQVEAVNGRSPEERSPGTVYEDLTPLHPNRRLILETDADEHAMRVIDLITPIGMGQRGLIVSPPRAGKTVLLQKIALSIRKNHPECYLIVLLVDERPEEVTDMVRTVSGPTSEVVASTFDEPPSEHLHVSDIALEKAKRMVEHGRHVVLLLDSITRLARAYNTEAPSGGKLLSGGLDSNAMQKPKRFFGAARNVENGGSLTILATALVDTGSRMDEVIFEEFKGTGNMELHLDRRLVDKRVWPAIDINRSGTRKEELLLHPNEVDRVRTLRRVLSDMHPVEAMELMSARLRKTKTNAEFLMSMNM